MNIKDLRQQTGLTQQQLAALTGIPKRSIENWESGQRTPPEYIPRLLAAFLRENGYAVPVGYTLVT